MSNPTLIKTVTASGTVPANRVVKPHASIAGAFVAAAAVADLLVAVCIQPGGATDGARMDIQLGGLADVEAGAAIAAGALLTVDSSGRVVTAAPATGVNNGIIGVAFDAAGAAGDIIRVLLAPSKAQG